MVSPARRLGFTLIELMVVAVISAVLISGGLAAYLGVGERESLKQAGLNFQSNLRLTQQKALSGEKPSGCSGNLEGYRVANGADLFSYQVTAECTVTDGDPVSYILGDQIKLQNALTEDIVFPILSNGVTGAQTVTLTNTSGSFSYEVVVEASGVIRGGLI